jgi:hypothetical protein
VYLTKGRISSILNMMKDFIEEHPTDIRSGLCYIIMNLDFEPLLNDDDSVYSDSIDLQQKFEYWFSEQRPSLTLYPQFHQDQNEEAQDGAYWFYSWGSARAEFLTQLIKDNNNGN